MMTSNLGNSPETPRFAATPERPAPKGRWLKRIGRRILYLALFLLLWPYIGWWILGGPPPFYRAEPMYGSVVDAESGAPIDGAVVVANWRIISGTHNLPYVLLETRTDANGRYQLPGWGPRLRSLNSWFDAFDLQIRVVKRGYEVAAFDNQHGTHQITRRSEWNGKALPLRVFEGDSHGMFSSLDGMLFSYCISCRMSAVSLSVTCPSLPLLAAEAQAIAPSLGEKEGAEVSISARTCAKER
jgi:hypothetical protein